MKPRLNLTHTTGMVLEAIARGRCFGFEIMEVSGLPDGTVYPALRRLEGAGMLTSEWEDEEKALAQKRPRRRYYSLTADGAQLLERARARYPRLEFMLGELGTERA